MPTNGNDILRIGAGQEVYGLGGADDFTWLGGNATIHGGDGGENYDDNVYMDKTGGDRLHISEAVKINFSSTEDGVAVAKSGSLVFDGIERIHLGDGNDVIRAGNANVERWGLSIWAGGGNDDIIGSKAGDFIDGGAGNDTIRAGAGDDFVQSSTGNDLIYGGAGNDNIRWGQGNFQEVIGNDTIYGGSGHDLINVWVKDGYLTNGKGVAVNIVKVNNDGAMKLTAETDIGGAHSTLKAQGFEQGWTHQGMDTVDGSGAQIVGETGMRWSTRWGDDILIGTSGNDTLEGGEGRDTITGGKGNDLISANGEFWNLNTHGDGYQDTLIFRAGDGHDTVIGFDANVDVLDLGGRNYTITDTREGTVLTAGQDSILLYGIHDFYI
jgi:Ca2+-binding RTX toxin-like protein